MNLDDLQALGNMKMSLDNNSGKIKTVEAVEQTLEICHEVLDIFLSSGSYLWHISDY